jgi:uncharacterized protein (DUF1501 family)
MVLVSPAGSFVGYNFKTWIIKNKETLKILAMSGAALGTFAATKSLGLEWQAVIVPVVTAFSRLIVDSIDFVATDVELEQKV